MSAGASGAADRRSWSGTAHWKNEVLLPTQVALGPNESFEAGLRRFNKRVQQDGILAEARRRKHFEKPSVRRKKKEAARDRKARRAALKASKALNSEYAF